MERPSPGPEHECATRLPLAEALRSLGVGPDGLATAEALRRLSVLGPNRLPVPPARHGRRLFAQMTHLMAVLLWVGGGLAFAADLPQLGVAIWLVNLGNAVFAFAQEHRAERTTAALLALVPARALVIRDGGEREIAADDLVPGDILLLQEGDRVPADARLLEAADLSVDQSALTGESEPVPKAVEVGAVPAAVPPTSSMGEVVAGSTVLGGAARALVCATGGRTAFGRIASLTSTLRPVASPLERELRRLTRIISAVAVGIGLAFFALALLSAHVPVEGALLFALGMIVAFVPEGLLPTVTLALSIGTQRMARHNALVKKLSAVEALGSCTVICSDKTGTLTRNEMTAHEVELPDGGRAIFEAHGYEPRGEVCISASEEDAARRAVTDLLEACVLASDAVLRPPARDGDGWSVLGDPTEGAMLVAAKKMGLDPDALRRRAPRRLEHPFDARRKRMSAAYERGADLVLFVKGAPAELLVRCARFRVRDDVRALDDATRARILRQVDASAGQGYRVIGVARRSVPGGEPLGDADTAERDLTYLGFVALLDPPRVDVPEAVERCHRAGIRLFMVTGDHPLAALSIARRIGIVQGERAHVLAGDALDGMEDAELARLLDEEVVFARVTPEQKLRVVSVLQAGGHTVAVTGDGVNDAPALKRADIGVAMGKSGTDVARTAADIVLLDDHFASIVNAIEEGRAVFDNIRRFTSYIFTSNVPEALPFVFFALSGGRIPLALGVMHILCVDLGTDLVPALALGAEAPERGTMERPPRGRDEHLIDTRLLLRAYLFLGPIQGLLVMAVFFAHYWANGFAGSFTNLPSDGPLYAGATGMALAAVVATQIGNLFAHRSARAAGGLAAGAPRVNTLLYVGILTEIVLLLVILYVPPVAAVIGTGPFPGAQWAWPLALVPALFVADRLWSAAASRAQRRREARRTSAGASSRAAVGSSQ